MVVVEILRRRLDGRSTIINCLIWVGFANEADADFQDDDIDLDADADQRCKK